MRTARLQADITMQQMAEELETTAAFLSAIETGRKKIPNQWVEKIESFFKQKGQKIEQLSAHADVSNGQVSLESLAPAQQMLMAGFARANLDDDQIKKFEELLSKVTKG